MSDSLSERQELLEAVAERGRLRPEWRLGQLIANVAAAAGRMEAGGTWDLEDAEAIAAAKQLIRDCRDHQEVA